jgi:hypothetical protein
MSRSSARAIRTVAGLILVALPTLVLSGAGCVEAESRFFVANFCPPITEESAECEIAFSAVALGFSGCNVATEICAGPSTVLSARLINRMTSSLEGDVNNNDVETGDIIVTGYDVRMNNGLGREETFIFNGYGLIPPGDEEGTQFGFQLLPLNSEGFAMLEDVNASGEVAAGFAGVRFYGRTTGGLEVETPEAFLSVTFFP